MIATVVVAVLTAAVAVLAFPGVLRWYRCARGMTASDVMVASREVSPLWNASAISGEYISAAAFLGTAGLVLAYGVDMLWMPVGAAAGFVVLLAFVTGPLRRSGAYTISDFAEWRLESPLLRRIVSGCVCIIGWFYLLPQFQGAGITLRTVAGAPVWAGWASVVVAVLAAVLTGGMRSITVVQAVQFWLKLLVLAVPAVVLLTVWRMDGGKDPTTSGPPVFARDTQVTVQVGVTMRVTADTPVRVTGVVDGVRRAGPVRLPAGAHTVGEGTRLAFPAGSAVPHTDRLPVLSGQDWAMPFAGGREHPLYATYSALVGMLLGTMGLPHIVMRFYTNTCGRAARRTAAMVPMLLALFHVFPILFGALGRLYTPELLMTGDTDATILALPGALAPGLPGELLTGLVAAGAFAAFISTSCGIAVAVGGTIAQRVLRGGVGSFRLGAVFALVAPLAVVAWVGPLGAAGLVTLAFSVSACSLCPLLVLGMWWRRLTAPGAVAGVLVGGGLAVTAGLVQLFDGPRTGWPGTLLAQPTMIIVPVAFAVMLIVSLLTADRIPAQVDRQMARLHLPEELRIR
jgi:Na+(H+)/acetate symporter ActP